MYQSGVRILRLLVGGLVIAVLAACASTYRNSGYVPSEDELAELVVGVDDRSAVEAAVGRPATQGVVAEEAWYFIGSRWEYYAYREPTEIERQVVAISFNDSGTIRNIERFSLEDGEVIALNRRITDSTVEGVSFLNQILSNFGQLNADQFLN
ncbi:outer membrane protein assembly factor BamE [Tropicimonas sp. S265A]|uniref:outer membrane protein assembly factor BamE n=1 Tax=Tropicimonas sp. S265A TaxID=3415134 RepID=UPI003C7B2AFC